MPSHDPAPNTAPTPSGADAELTVQELEVVSGGVDVAACDISCLPNAKCTGTD